MAIAKMSRMKLVGLKSEQEKILSALHKTCAIQIISNESDITSQVETNGFAEKFDKLSFACDFLFSNVNRISKENKDVAPLKEEVYGVTYDQFVNALSLEATLEPTIKTVYEVYESINDLKVERAKLESEKSVYKPFIGLKQKFSAFLDTAKTRVFLGTLKPSSANAFLELDLPCKAYIECEDAQNAVLSVVCLQKDENLILQNLTAVGFSRTNLSGDFTAQEKVDEIDRQIKIIDKKLLQCDQKISEARKDFKDMKILLDRYRFELELSRDKNGFEKTDSTFILDAYVPTEATDRVEEAVKGVSDMVFTQFTEIPKDEFAPTLMKNKKLTKQFEFVTNLYSPPKYGTIDQNFVMMIFFSIFMGFIMADIGYGLVMIVGGILMAKKIGRDTGVARLSNIIAFGGVFTVLFGVLFDSFFGYGLLRGLGVLDSPIMPDAINHKLNVAGISVPTLLLLSLGMGVVQIMASLLLKAAQNFKDGHILDGIFDGVSWAVFLGGLILLVVDMAGLTTGLTMPAVIIIAVSVLVGALTAGRHAKGFGKVTKSFSAVYGLINYMSDILSYARLYGLMLSGAQIAGIVTNMALPMMHGAMSIAAVLILIIGHVFNLAMGLLGAYIHDSRLQYIEFYGRFYEGEGELFCPFGTKFENVYFADKN